MRVEKRHQRGDERERIQGAGTPPDAHSEYRQAAHDRGAHHTRARASQDCVETDPSPGSRQAAPASEQTVENRDQQTRNDREIEPADRDNMRSACESESIQGFGRDPGLDPQQNARQKPGFGVWEKGFHDCQGFPAQRVNRLAERVPYPAVNPQGALPPQRLITGWAVAAAQGGVNAPMGKVSPVREFRRFKGGSQPSLQPDPVAVLPVAAGRQARQQKPLHRLAHLFIRRVQALRLYHQQGICVAELWILNDASFYPVAAWLVVVPGQMPRREVGKAGLKADKSQQPDQRQRWQDETREQRLPVLRPHPGNLAQKDRFGQTPANKKMESQEQKKTEDSRAGKPGWNCTAQQPACEDAAQKRQ